MNIDLIEFCEFYKTHSTKSTKEHFNLTDKPFKELLLSSGLVAHTKAENIKLTNIEKYGCENVFQSQVIKDKSAKTKLDKYGNSSYNNSISREKTCLEKYGTKSASGNKEIQEKIKSTNLNKYGVDNLFKDRGRIESSYIEKYGSVENFNAYCERRRKEELLKKYGVSNSSQIPGTREKAEYKRRVTCLERYGVESATLLPQCMFSNGDSSSSIPNKRFADILSQAGVEFTQEFTITNRSYDFKIDNILIEINPFATHNSTWSPFGEKWIKDKLYHFNKSKLASDNGYRCICVWDWDDIDKILNLLKVREKIYARNCEVKEVNKEDSKAFIERYHLQGYVRDDIRIGLHYNNELVSIMTFGKPRYNKNFQYELLRYCALKNVIGGAEKIFTYFLKNYNPDSVISYCDLSKFDGKTYEKLGFILKKVSIGKHWYNIKTKQHITDNLLRQRGFDQLFGTDYGKGTSNEELMRNANFVEIYDCGQAAYQYFNKIK